MHLFISAGEPSGDLHGANLIRALKRLDPNLRVSGFGGEKMEQAGCHLLYPLTKLAVMWFLRAILNIFTFIRLLNRAKHFLKEHRPDAVIVIDFPGFHFALAKRAHSLGIPVYYFVPPQLWAWAGWRVKKMQKWVKTILSALPFEHEWYRARNTASVFIGHPYFDELAHQPTDPMFLLEQRKRPERVIGILPGSRMQEVTKNLPEMLKAAASIHRQEPNTRFLVASFNEAQAEVAQKMIQGATMPIQIHVKRTPEIIELAEACIAVSGSVSLELMYRLKPTVVHYRLGRIAIRIGRWFMRCKYITLVNLLADEEIFPEFLTSHDRSAEVADRVLRWLRSPAEVDEVRRKLRAVKDQVAQPGACDRAAAYICEQVTGMRVDTKTKAA